MKSSKSVIFSPWKIFRLVLNLQMFIHWKESGFKSHNQASHLKFIHSHFNLLGGSDNDISGYGVSDFHSSEEIGKSPLRWFHKVWSFYSCDLVESKWQLQMKLAFWCWKKPSRFKQLFCVTRNCEFACSLRFEGFLKTEVLKIIWRLAPTRLKNIKFEMPWLFQSQGTEAHFLSIRERNDPGLDLEKGF